MPRNNRTTSRPTSSNFNKTQQRAHSTSASNSSSLQSTKQQPQQPAVIQVQNGGILSNILQTAAGVAVGHTVGRMVSGLFEGSSNSNNENTSNNAVYEEPAKACQVDTQRFLDCMSRNYDDVSACQNYLDMLKACQRQFGQ